MHEGMCLHYLKEELGACVQIIGVKSDGSCIDNKHSMEAHMAAHCCICSCALLWMDTDLQSPQGGANPNMEKRLQKRRKKDDRLQTFLFFL